MTIKHDLSIVVADDVELTRAMIKSALIKTGYSDIRIANNADDVLKLLETRRADVVLADWIMPEMDGLELTNRIRQMDEDRGHYTSVIMVTSKDGVEHMVEAFEHGVDDYLKKPVDERELSARVYAAGRVSTLQNTLLETTQSLEYSNQQLREMATTDPLTALGNRRYVHQRLASVIAETEARGGAIACLIIDLDHFKQINDGFGHAVGDEVLIGLAKRLRRAVRPTDTVGRIGGEEFCVVMHFADPAHLRPVIFERVLTAINQRPFQTSQGEIMVTASIGVSRYEKGDEMMNMEMLLQRADEKLYQAKAAGRNRVGH